MYLEHIKSILALINDYFDGVYVGDVAKLRGSFTQNAHLYGDINGAEYSKSLDEYLQGVANRQSPAELNEKFEMEVIGIEVIGNVASAKVHLPMLGYNYYDFLSLSKVAGKWKIVSKVFAHVE